MAAPLRPAVPADAAALARIHAASFPRGWGEADFTAFATDPSYLCLVACHPGEAAASGFVLCRCAAPEAEMFTLAVLPGSRGQGLARVLTEAALDQLRASRVTELFLEVDADNDTALGLYESLGFVRIGARKGYYAQPAGGAPADALTMCLHLR